LVTGNGKHALIQVRPQDEQELMATFRQTLDAREPSPQAKIVADRRSAEGRFAESEEHGQAGRSVGPPQR
jgi:hypothetical protein